MKLASYTGFVKSSDPKNRDEYPCLTMPKAFVERSAKNCGKIVYQIGITRFEHEKPAAPAKQQRSGGGVGRSGLFASIAST